MGVGLAAKKAWQPKRLEGIRSEAQKQRKIDSPQVSTHVFPQIAKLWGSCYGVLISNNNEEVAGAGAGCRCWCCELAGTLVL